MTPVIRWEASISVQPPRLDQRFELVDLEEPLGQPRRLSAAFGPTDKRQTTRLAASPGQTAKKRPSVAGSIPAASTNFPFGFRQAVEKVLGRRKPCRPRLQVLVSATSRYLGASPQRPGGGRLGPLARTQHRQRIDAGNCPGESLQDRPVRPVLEKVRDVVAGTSCEPKRRAFIALADLLIRPGEARVLRVRDWTGDELRVERAAKDRMTRGVVRGPKKATGT